VEALVHYIGWKKRLAAEIAENYTEAAEKAHQCFLLDFLGLGAAFFGGTFLATFAGLAGCGFAATVGFAGAGVLALPAVLT